MKHIYRCIWCPWNIYDEDFMAQEHLAREHGEICFKEDLCLFFQIDGHRALYEKDQLNK